MQPDLADNAKPRRRTSFLSIARLVAINIIVCLCLLEIALRVQQKLGPLYDLDLHFQEMMPELSEQLNHVPQVGTLWDSNGIRILDQPNREPCFKRVLFLGDSFMEGVKLTPEGYVPTSSSDTVPVQVRHFYRELTRRNLCVFNAGFGSYAPSIYVPQAKRLVPLIKPDLVVIDVDETDIWDDFYRYRKLTVRDANGSIIAVRPSPLGIRFNQGLVASTQKLFYVHRFLAKLYFTRVEFPKLVAAQERPSDNLALAKLSGTELRTDHAAEVAYFNTTLEDLTTTVVSLMGGPDALIYIHHPHLQHLRATGEVFNNVVAESVSEVAARHGVRFYDAAPALRSAFGGEPEKYYIPNDMHFNPAGTRMYGMAVAKWLAAELTKD
jgi:hypothetical protein